MSEKKDMTGLRSYYLVVLCEDGRTKDGKAKWKCQCDCGKIVSVTGDKLRNQHQKSCGCKTSELLSKARTKHGLQLTNKRLHDSIQQHFLGLRTGGRGCKGWVLDARYINDPDGVVSFCRDVIALYPDECAKYESDTSLELDKDSNANKVFCPESLRFVNRKQNCNNRRNTLRIEDGTSLAEFCSRVGIETFYKGHPSKQYRRIQEMFRLRHKAHPELVQKANELIALYTKTLKMVKLLEEVRRFASAADVQKLLQTSRPISV